MIISSAYCFLSQSGRPSIGCATVSVSMAPEEPRGFRPRPYRDFPTPWRAPLPSRGAGLALFGFAFSLFIFGARASEAFALFRLLH